MRQLIWIPVLGWDKETQPEPVRVDRFALWVPPPWRHLTEEEPMMTAFKHPEGELVIVSAIVEQDGEQWLHVSVSRRDRLPSYEDLRGVKEDFVGDQRWAAQVFPRAAEHVNCHPNCLHLWSCLTRQDLLPDFRRGRGLI